MDKPRNTDRIAGRTAGGRSRRLPLWRGAAAFAASTLLAVTGVAATSPSAYAAPPANDSIATARTITSIPTRIVQDTRAATPSAEDGDCVLGDSVWYRFRPTTATTARVVTIGSRFDTVLAVFRGPRASRTQVACNDDDVDINEATQLRFASGVTYWIAVSACCEPSATGGRSVLTLYRPRPAATHFTLGSVETGAVSGRLFASGTVRCATTSVADVSVAASQRVGRFVAHGTGVSRVPLCGPKARKWTVSIDSETAVAFRKGTASVTVHVDSFDGFNLATAEQTRNVSVSSNPNRRARN